MFKLRPDLLAYGRSSNYFNIIALFALFFWATPVNAAQEEIKIIAFGDSLTAGYGLPQSDAFPVQLQAALREKGINVRVENAGVSGDTSSGGAQRLDWALNGGADFVLLELGANDALRGIEPAVTRKSLITIIEKLKSQNIPIFLTGMKAPPNMGANYRDEFDQIYIDLADQYKLAFYPFFLEGVAAIPSLNQEDAIHPNKEGVAIIVEKMVPFLISFINNQ